MIFKVESKSITHLVLIMGLLMMIDELKWDNEIDLVQSNLRSKIIGLEQAWNKFLKLKSWDLFMFFWTMPNFTKVLTLWLVNPGFTYRHGQELVYKFIEFKFHLQHIAWSSSLSSDNLSSDGLSLDSLSLELYKAWKLSSSVWLELLVLND